MCAKQGDRALLRYAPIRRPQDAASLRVTQTRWPRRGRRSIPRCARLIHGGQADSRLCAAQLPASWSFSVAGLTTGQLVRPLGSVGCYVPSGRHPLPSTLLMTAIPAQVAGVQRIVVVSPKPAPETLAAAHLLGITEFYRLGGAHAIAALAYGTATHPRVDKIVGPGNLYVTAAKRLVAFDCAIDMLAGPTEIVVTSERGNAADIASDLVAQAEHDPEALAIFITTRADLAKEVIAEAKLRSRNNPSRARLSIATAWSSSPPRGRSARRSPIASRPSTSPSMRQRSRLGSERGLGLRRPLVRAAHGRLHLRTQSHAAHRRHGARARRPQRQRLRQAHHRAGVHAQAMRSLGPQAILLAEAEGLTGHAEAIRTRFKRGGPVTESVSGHDHPCKPKPLAPALLRSRPAPACRP
jgi:histidinol dehydrogenase